MFHVVYYQEFGCGLNDFLAERFVNRLCDKLFCSKDDIRLYDGYDEQAGFKGSESDGIDRYFTSNPVSSNSTIIAFYILQNKQGEWYAEFIEDHHSGLVEIDKNIFKDPANKNAFNFLLELKKYDFKVVFHLTYEWEKSIENDRLENLKSLLLQIPKHYLQSGVFENESIYLGCYTRIFEDKNNPHIACLDRFGYSGDFEFIGICSNVNEYAILIDSFEHSYNNRVKVGDFNFFPNIPIFILDFETNTFQIWYNFQQIFNHSK